MAEQPSITSILAALAAQHGAPAQNPPAQQPQQARPEQYQPQPPQQQYPPAQPQQSYNAAPYALPQPTHSGSVDLSSIKPVNSGTVSIADAIAKAKAIAAEKGLSYDRQQAYGNPDMRGGSGPPRQHTQQRSRSRSPPPNRREPYRDNYNPYRDERRNERPPAGRDQYGRERSFSPVPRRGGPPQPFSPGRGGNGGNGYPIRDRSPMGRGGGGGGGAGGDGDNTESISIESNLVGLIIGRQGENLRRVESETGCRVQFITNDDANGPYRQCKITGPRPRRADAIAEINRIILDSGMGSGIPVGREGHNRDSAPPRATSNQPPLREGEDTMQIMVPDRTVGLIIGRGGETIRDLQERSGCHVNIVGEQKSVNGLRPVNLIGSREAAAKAKDLIMEIVESDSKSTAEKARGPPQREPARDMGYGGGGGGGGGGGPDKINDSIYVPSEAVGMIIGKGGETIKDMQNTTGCKINVSPSSGPGETEREIGLVGSKDSIERAKRAIEDKVEAVQMKNGGGGGAGGGRRGQQNDYGDRSFSQQPQSYGGGGGGGQAQAQQGQPPAAAGGEDPYAAYGGYNAYVALWYQVMAAQGQQQPGGPAQPPPGTS